MPPPDLTRAVAARKQLVETIKAMFPDETEEALQDTIDGESDFDETVLSVLRDAIHREAHADAIEGMIETLGVRKRRLVEGAQRLRNAALDAMQEAGVPKIQGPDITASVRAGVAKVVITDQASIPDIYIRVKREPDKKAIGDVLKQGYAVAGASLGNPIPYVAVNRT